MNLSIVVAVASLALSTAVEAVPLHIVDGAFELDEWNPARSTVTVNSFTVGGVSNAAFLYVEQSNNGDPASGSIGNKLDLMYDYVNSSGADPFNAAFDVFFQVGDTDYAVHIPGFGSLQAFEKPTGTVSLLKPDGSLDLTTSPWTFINPSDPDIALAQFVGAVGFGASPNSSTHHLLAEFELSVDNGASNGLYSPDPSFWSASTSNRELGRTCKSFDPFFGCLAGSISSGDFKLNSDGTTTVVPTLGPDGGPVIQPVPESETWALILVGLGLRGVVAQRKGSRVRIAYLFEAIFTRNALNNGTRCVPYSASGYLRKNCVK